MLPLLLQRVRVSRRQLDCYVARDSGYITIAFISDAVDGRSAARERKTIVRQHVTFLQICASGRLAARRHTHRGGTVRAHERAERCRSGRRRPESYASRTCVRPRSREKPRSTYAKGGIHATRNGQNGETAKMIPDHGTLKKRNFLSGRVIRKPAVRSL